MTSEKRILMVGMNYMDLVHTVPSFPAHALKYWHDNGHWQRGGNASNACTVINNLGGKTEYFGTISESKGFQAIIDDFQKNNIIIENCNRTHLNPPFSSIILNSSNSSRTATVYLHPEYPYVTIKDFQKLNLKNYSWIHFEGRFFENTLEMLNYAHKFNEDNPNNKIILSVELDHANEDLFKLTDHADYIFASKNFSRFCEYTTSPAAARGLRERIENKNCIIIVPWGDQGTAVLNTDNKFEVVDIYEPPKIVDSLGAGDAFIGGTIYSLTQGNSLFIAISFGNKVAGYKLQAYGYDNIKDLVGCAMECCVPTCDCCQSCSK